MLIMYRSLDVPMEECAAYEQVSVGESHYELVESKININNDKST